MSLTKPLRMLVLLAACWCAIFALMTSVQLLVLAAPPDLQVSLYWAWAVAAAVYSPVAAYIIRKAPQ